jgi:hypothetical protein
VVTEWAFFEGKSGRNEKGRLGNIGKWKLMERICVEQVDSGSQEAKSEQVMEVPAKLDGLEMTNHLKDLFADVAKREMMLHSVVTIAGSAVVWKWKHNFEVSWV